MFSTCAILDMNNPTTDPCSLPATLHINAAECPRPAWQHCCHRVFTCQILMYMHCVLCFLSRACPSPFTPTPSHLLFSPVHGALPPPPLPNTTSPTSSSHPDPPPHHHWHRCMCCCMACGPPTPRLALASHTPGPLGHSGRRGVQGLPDQPGLRYRQRYTGT